MKKEYSQTLLSPESLAIKVVIEPREQALPRRGLIVYKNKTLRADRVKRYKLIFPPVLGWYPSKHASFTVDVGRGINPEWYLQQLPRYMNPSVWINKRNGCYTIRVSRNYRHEAHKHLYKHDFWFSTRSYIWYKRQRRKN